jgi:hypothetical protein
MMARERIARGEDGQRGGCSGKEYCLRRGWLEGRLAGKDFGWRRG